MATDNSSRPLVYSHDHASAGYILMEMTEDMLKMLVEEGRFTLKGTENEDAVLCTKKTSFLVREAPSSNSLLLLDSHPVKSEHPQSVVIRTLNAFYQLNRTSADIERLKSLLYPTALNFPNFSDIPSATLYKLEDLENIMQCSIEELHLALQAIGATTYEGYQRVLSLEAEYAIAKHLCLTTTSESMDPLNLDREDLLEKSQDDAFPTSLQSFVLDSYLVRNPSNTYSFNARKYVVLLSHVTIRQKQTCLLSSLLSLVKQKVPDHFYSEIDATALEGLACTEEQGNDTKLTYLNSATLSHNPKLRLAELFKLKQKWTFAQIRPYLQDLLSQDANEEQILVAHTRSSNGPGGVKLYSSR